MTFPLHFSRILPSPLYNVCSFLSFSSHFLRSNFLFLPETIITTTIFFSLLLLIMIIIKDDDGAHFRTPSSLFVAAFLFSLSLRHHRHRHRKWISAIPIEHPCIALVSSDCPLLAQSWKIFFYVLFYFHTHVLWPFSMVFLCV